MDEQQVREIVQDELKAAALSMATEALQIDRGCIACAAKHNLLSLENGHQICQSCAQVMSERALE